MKDQLMQKVTQVPSYPEISETMPVATPARAETTDFEKERKNRKSAAMIGFAISMGATGVLLPSHSPHAMAAISPLEAAPLTSVSETTEPTQRALELAPPEIKHKVQQGETIWDLSQNYEIAPEKIAQSNRLKSKTPLLVGQTVNIPVPQAEESQPVQSLSNSGSTPEQLPVGKSLPVRDNVEELLQQPRQGMSPLIASQPNLPNSAPQGLNQVAPNAIAIQVIPPGNPNPISAQQGALSPNPSAYSSNPSSLREQPKVIRESGKPIPSLPPQVGIVSSKQVSLANNNPLPVENPIQQSQQNAPVESSTVGEPVVIPVQTPRANNSLSSESIATRPIPQVIRQDSFSTPFPNNSSSQSQEKFYQVQSGDTLNSIARRYGISRAELMQANGITNPNLIKVSQQLVIPSRNVPINRYQGTNLVNNRVNQNIQPNYLGRDNSGEAPVNNPYINNLKSEINTLEQSAQNQEGIPIPVVAPFNNNQQAVSVAVNPEWRRNQSNNLPLSPSARNYNNSSFEQPQIIGAVPIPVEQYNPMLNPDNGQMVSPDSYFPNNNTTFTGYIWPAKGVLTSGYGWRWGRMHKGVDVAAPVGTPIVAAAAGEVISAGWNSGGYGNLVKLRHFDGSVTLYAHNNRILVRKGQFVEQGQQISEMGNTGFSTGPHLHFEVHPTGKGAVNPIAFLPPRSAR